MDKRKVRDAAHDLLAASKAALRVLSAPRISKERREVVVQLLQDAIDSAETVDTELTITMTHTTAARLDQIVTAGSPRLREAIANGRRETKRRVYVTLETEILLLKELRSLIIKSTWSVSQRALDRIVNQLDEEISKSPLQRLAELAI